MKSFIAFTDADVRVFGDFVILPLLLAGFLIWLALRK